MRKVEAIPHWNRGPQRLYSTLLAPRGVDRAVPELQDLGVIPAGRVRGDAWQDRKRGTVPRMRLPAGVKLHELRMHNDERGCFTEIFREEWRVGVSPVQWNVVRSEPSVLRGVHVHVRHADYLTVLHGRALVGLRDLRRHSPTANLVATVELRGDGMAAITIPPGVAHGFLFLEPSLHIYAVSHYWSVDDELGCRADDPDLEIEWPPGPFHLSERDATAQPLVALLDELEPHQSGLSVASDAVPHG